jgi:two-component system chemotaxis response regulator CheB
VLIVQHMPPLFTRMLAERLDKTSALHVVEASEGLLVTPGTVVLAPGDWHMELQRVATGLAVHLQQGPPEHSCRPAVDVLFRSAARHCGAGVLAAVLTGMGRDGVSGAEQIRNAGGQVIVQDEATSVVWGMPGFVANAGLADAVLPLAAIGPEIVHRVGSGVREALR